MLTKFFFMLREGGMKPSITELLTLLEAMQSGVAGNSVDDFYYLARSCLVKDETQFDRFDQIFAAHETLRACRRPGRCAESRSRGLKGFPAAVRRSARAS